MSKHAKFRNAKVKKRANERLMKELSLGKDIATADLPTLRKHKTQHDFHFSPAKKD